MEVCLRKSENTWTLSPTEGVFEGQVIAEVEGVSMKNAHVEGRTIVGTICALWGVTLKCVEAFDDIDFVRSLHMGAAFPTELGQKLKLDFDGLSTLSGGRNAPHTCVKTAKRISVLNDTIYGRNYA